MPVCEMYECFSEILGFPLVVVPVVMMLGMLAAAGVLLAWGRWGRR